MRIAHIITGLATGGAERALYNLLRGGLQAEFDNLVISLSDAGTYGAKIEGLGVRTIILNMREVRNLIPSLNKLRQVIKEFQPDVIQGWMYHGNIAASISVKLNKRQVPVIWNIRHSLYDIRKEKSTLRYIIRINRMLSRGADKILYNSLISKQQHESIGFYANHSIVIPNGFDMEQWKPKPELKNIVCKELGLNESVKLVGHFARYHPMKDHATFLSAVEDVCKNNNDIHFLMAGKGIDYSNQQLNSKIHGNMSNRVHLLGERDDVENLMPALDVFCLSSSWGEAFPNVLGEAMACNVPCVTTDVGDSKSIVGEHGLVVESGDPSAMANAILTLLSQSDSKEWGKNGKLRSHIQENYSLSVIVNRYVEIYNECINLKENLSF